MSCLSTQVSALVLAGLIGLPMAAHAAPAQSGAKAPSFDQLGDDGTVFDPATLRTTSKSTTLRSVQWGSMREIPVCWENPLPQHEANRQRARAAVAQTWEAAANVRFIGWGTCQPGQLAVRINVGPTEWPRAKLGRWGLRSDTSMWLNFDMPRMAGFEGCADKVERCEAFAAVHEFGHTLGLVHEQDRPDTPANCRAALSQGQITARPNDDLVMITGYDAQSLMNYCSNRGWNPAVALALTPEDKAGVVAMFGPRPAAEPPQPPGRRRRPVFVPD